MSFATEFFTDNVAFIDPGFPPGGYSGTMSGSPIWAADPAPIRKLGFLGTFAGGGGGVTLAIYTATASTGPFASWSTSATGAPCSASLSAGASGQTYILYGELRDEALTDLNNNGWWIRPVLTIAGATTAGALNVLGFLSGHKPASKYNSPTLGAVVTFYMM